MRIALIRHPAPLIASGICYGRLDVAVHPSTDQQLAADPALAGATRVWTSPARRCRGLAETIAQRWAVPLTVDPRLQELDFGEWEGRPWDAIPRPDLDRWAASPLTFAPPGGESGAALIGRVREFHAALRQDQQDCIVVSHGGPLKLLAALLLATPLNLLAAPPPMGSLTIVTPA
ncbi:MAG: alpha-ribazole phosphatase [Acetobacteraceae bacterium]|nr:alpha-ribazole phosphatase [Acetobacteraceae bacterium]